MMRRFQLHRKDDESGVSGTGIVAEGVESSNGNCVLFWLTEVRSISATYANIKDVELIHGHGGKTVIEWVDGEGDKR